MCSACVDGRRAGWCASCAGRAEARLEVSSRAKLVLLLAVLGVLVFPAAAVSWWLGRSMTQVLEADEPLLEGARWLQGAALLLWSVGVLLWIGQR